MTWQRDSGSKWARAAGGTRNERTSASDGAGGPLFHLMVGDLAYANTTNPPTIVLFTNSRAKLHFSNERYLMNQLRKRFGFEGTPIVVKTKGRTEKKRA